MVEATERDLQQELVVIGRPFALDEHGLALNGSGKPTLEECTTAAAQFKRVHGALKYWVGDLVVTIEKLFGEESAQIIDAGWLPDSFVNEARVLGERVALPERQIAQSQEHALAVAPLKQAEQRKFLQLSLDEDWSAAKLKTEVQAELSKGKSKPVFLLIADCGTEEKQGKMAALLEKEGCRVTKRSGLRKEAKPKRLKAGKKEKAVRKKKGPVTAKRRRAPKMYSRRRVPK